MLARAHTFTTEGLHVQRVTVEVDIRAGLPAFVIVGLADAAVREARERAQAAIRNCGYEFPSRRITASLAPADVRKVGPGLDLALACAVLAANGQAPRARLGSYALFGELSLDGSVHACRGTLAVAQAAADAGLAGLVLASCEADEARLVENIEVAPVGTMRSAVRVLSGGRCDRPGRVAGESARRRDATARDAVATGVDLCEGAGSITPSKPPSSPRLARTMCC